MNKTLPSNPWISQKFGKFENGQHALLFIISV